GDAPPTLRPAPGSVLVFRDENVSQLNPQQIAQLGYFQADTEMPDGSASPHSGRLRRLILGEDYLAHSSGLWIVLRVPLCPEQAPAGMTPTLRLVRGPEPIHQPGQPTWKYEMRQVYRLDSSSGVELGSVELAISLGELSGGITYRDYAGQQVPFLKLFGMDEDAPIDQIDAVQIYQPGRDVFGGISQDGQIGGTYIVFPTLRPFAEPPPVPSIGLSADDARAILAT